MQGSVAAQLFHDLVGGHVSFQDAAHAFDPLGV
jgi:hypothetical protein